MDRQITTTRVGIVGGGPAGLMLSHLLAREGVDNVVIDNRDHDLIARTHRAGILEAGSVRMLTDTGVDGRILDEGYERSGLYLRFNGENHHIDFKKLLAKRIQPPFKPSVASAVDTSNFDPQFTHEAPTDSVVESSEHLSETFQRKFADFSYDGSRLQASPA